MSFTTSKGIDGKIINVDEEDEFLVGNESIENGSILAKGFVETVRQSSGCDDISIAENLEDNLAEMENSFEFQEDKPVRSKLSKDANEGTDENEETEKDEPAPKKLLRISNEESEKDEPTRKELLRISNEEIEKDVSTRNELLRISNEESEKDDLAHNELLRISNEESEKDEPTRKKLLRISNEEIEKDESTRNELLRISYEEIETYKLAHNELPRISNEETEDELAHKKLLRISNEESEKDEPTRNELPRISNEDAEWDKPARSKLSKTLQRLLGTAIVFNMNGRKEEAAQIYHHIMAKQPDAHEPYSLLATHYLSEGRRELAKCYASCAAYLKPNSSEEQLKIAEISEEDGEIDNAIDYYTQALKYDFKNVEIHERRERLLCATNKYCKAVRSYATLIKQIRDENEISYLSKKIADYSVDYENDGRKAIKWLEYGFERCSATPRTENIILYLRLLGEEKEFTKILDTFSKYCGLEITRDSLAITKLVAPAKLNLRYYCILPIALVGLREMACFASRDSATYLKIGNFLYDAVAMLKKYLSQYPGELKVLLVACESLVKLDRCDDAISLTRETNLYPESCKSKIIYERCKILLQLSNEEEFLNSGWEFLASKANESKKTKKGGELTVTKKTKTTNAECVKIEEEIEILREMFEAYARRKNYAEIGRLASEVNKSSKFDKLSERVKLIIIEAYVKNDDFEEAYVSMLNFVKKERNYFENSSICDLMSAIFSRVKNTDKARKYLIRELKCAESKQTKSQTLQCKVLKSLLANINSQKKI